MQAHCTKGLKGKDREFSRFWARCKLCGGEDRWGTINPELSAVGRSQFGGAPYTADQDAEIYLATVNSNDLRGGARTQMERQLQATDTHEEGDDD